LEENIELPIKKAFENVIKSENNDERIERQIYNELQIFIGSDKSARSRRLPIKYREE
jgi:hypothetical protein